MGIAMIIAAAVIAAMIAWFFIDMALGSRQKRKTASKKVPPLREGNVHFYAQGRPFFQSLFTAIEAAQDHIHMNFYIFRNDTLGQEMMGRLKRKAGEGVEVRLLVDWVGSHGLPKKTRDEMRQAGIEVAAAQKPHFPYFFYSFNRRNHRKITVIDGKTGFLGGYNVGDEYLGKDPNLGEWRDYHLRIKGDGCQDLQKQFLTDWEQTTGAHVNGARYFPRLVKGGDKFRLYATNAAFLEAYFLDLIAQANTSIVLGSPYYIPGRKVQQALLAARKRGVSVKLLLPMKKDHPLVHGAMMPYFNPLVRAGCDVFLFYEGFYHAKVMIVDEEMCDIGTANFDHRSFRFNNEINCFIYSPDVITKVLAALDSDFRRSEKQSVASLKNRSLADRAKDQVSSLFAPLL